ncbi:hypothetical protein HK102_001521, partial [Quaeritorhiza haematococci]
NYFARFSDVRKRYQATGNLVSEKTALEKVMDGIPGQEYVTVRSDLITDPLITDPKTTLDLARNKLMSLESSIRHMQTLGLATPAPPTSGAASGSVNVANGNGGNGGGAGAGGSGSGGGRGRRGRGGWRGRGGGRGGCGGRMAVVVVVVVEMAVVVMDLRRRARNAASASRAITFTTTAPRTLVTWRVVDRRITSPTDWELLWDRFLKRRQKDLELLTVMQSIFDTLRSAVDLDKSRSGSRPSTAINSRRESFASWDGVNGDEDTDENEEEILEDNMLPVVKELLDKCKRFVTHDPAVETELSILTQRGTARRKMKKYADVDDISAQMPDESVCSTHQTQAVDDVPFDIPVSSSTSRSWPKIRFWKLVSRKFKVAWKRLVKIFPRIPGKLFPIDSVY